MRLTTRVQRSPTVCVHGPRTLRRRGSRRLAKKSISSAGSSPFRSPIWTSRCRTQSPRTIASVLRPSTPKARLSRAGRPGSVALEPEEVRPDGPPFGDPRRRRGRCTSRRGCRPCWRRSRGRRAPAAPGRSIEPARFLRRSRRTGASQHSPSGGRQDPPRRQRHPDRRPHVLNTCALPGQTPGPHVTFARCGTRPAGSRLLLGLLGSWTWPAARAAAASRWARPVIGTNSVGLSSLQVDLAVCFSPR